jgi:hypothetical protein
MDIPDRMKYTWDQWSFHLAGELQKSPLPILVKS